ncbi:bifunctional DNA primase/polymerase [Lentzea jiangxiensis]|uniref:bifunctional DNA primase/polymerase n=1 Tax=Lentzea jiangxiensis TaxID=641025 RepID=UPI003CCBCD6B
MSLAYRGWPVLPGTYPTATENGVTQWAGRSGLELHGPIPVHRDWVDRIGTSPDQVATWWAGRSYSLLVATGHVVDAIEVGTALGRRAAVALRSIGVPVPIAATPSGRWMFLVKSGSTLNSELAGNSDVHHYAKGEYIPLPPTTMAHGVVHWRVKPQVCGWNLPDAHVVQDALVEAVRTPAGYQLQTA